MVLVLVAGVTVNDAKRWLSLGFTTFQPSEMAKIAGILYLSSLIAREPKVLNDDKAFLRKCISPIFLLCGLTAIEPSLNLSSLIAREPKVLNDDKAFLRKCISPIFLLCGLTAIEPSLSAAMSIGVGMLIVLFLSGVPLKRFLPYIGLAVAAVVVLMIAEPWRLERFNVFLGKGTTDYQITQSILAIGSGSLLGKGLGNGMQKYLFLPELQNDFIFANIGEECGLLGCLFVIVLYCVIIWRGIKIANACPDRFGYLYTGSVMILLGFQVVVNIGVATGVMPVTGMALPFVSAGGSSMLVLFAMLGPILNISRRVRL